MIIPSNVTGNWEGWASFGIGTSSYWYCFCALVARRVPEPAHGDRHLDAVKRGPTIPRRSGADQLPFPPDRGVFFGSARRFEASLRESSICLSSGLTLV